MAHRFPSFLRKTHHLEQPHLLWRFVNEVAPIRTQLHYQLVEAIITGYLTHLGPIFRREIFRWLTQDVIDDSFDAEIGDIMDCLVALTANGRDLSPFELDAGNTFSLWLSNRFDRMGVDLAMRLLGLLSVAISTGSAKFLSNENKTLLIQRACVTASGLRVASQVPMVEACLIFLEALVTKDGKLPPHCLVPLVSSLCCTVNIDKLSEVSWRIGHDLLASPLYGFATLDGLLEILRSKHGSQNFGSILRGAVFFVSMSCWGKDKIESLNVSPATVLPAMVEAMQCGWNVAALEVLLSVRRLIRKEGADLTIEWESIFLILYEMSAYVSSSPTFVRVLVDTLQTVTALSEKNQFLADSQKLLWLLEVHSALLPPDESLRLLRTRLSQFPFLTGAEELDQALHLHLVQDQRSQVRLTALSELMEWMTHGSPINAILLDDERAERVIPVWRLMLSNLISLPDGSERDSMLRLAQELAIYIAAAASGVRRQLFFDCVNMLVDHMTPRPSRKAAPEAPKPEHGDQLFRNAALVKVFDDAAAEGLAKIFLAELAASRGRRSRFVFDKLSELVLHPCLTVRQRALHYIAAIRADSSYTVTIFDTHSCVHIAGGSVSSTELSEISLHRVMRFLIEQWRVEPSRELSTAIFAAFYEWSWSRYVLRGIMLDSLALGICAHMREGRLLEPFRGHPGDGIKFVRTMLEVATMLSSFALQMKRPEMVLLELLKTFVHLIKYPFAGGVFDPSSRASLQRICMTGILLVAAHHPEFLSGIALVVVEAVCPLMDGQYLAGRVPVFFAFLARYSPFMEALDQSHCLMVLHALLANHSIGSDAAYDYQLLTVSQFLLSISTEDRIECYNAILPTLLDVTNGPLSLITEAHLDLMANAVFLQCSPMRGEATASSERYGFAGRSSICTVQGNVLMEVVTGLHEWVLVTVRRPSGRVVWVTRLQNELVPHHVTRLHPPQTEKELELAVTPIRGPWKALFREPEASAMGTAEALDSSLSLLGPAHQKDGHKNVNISILDIPAAKVRVVVAHQAESPSTAQVPATILAIINSDDPLPLNPLVVLDEIHASKPELYDFSQDSPRYGSRKSSAQELPLVQQSQVAYELPDDEDDALRLAPLDSYDEDPGAELERDRDTFFTSQSLSGGVRSQSAEMRSSGAGFSMSPTSPFKKVGKVSVIATTLGAALAPVPPLPTDATAFEVRHRTNSLLDSPKSPQTPGTPRTPTSSELLANQQAPASAVRRRPFSPIEGFVTESLITTSPSAVHTPPRRKATMHQSPSSAGSAGSGDLIAPHASFLFLQLRYLPFSNDEPIQVNQTPAIKRAISVLDYLPPHHTHKLGVLFVAKGQRTEEEIFSNTRGSVHFSRFLRSLGEFVRLKDYKGFAGGLDTCEDSDGEYAVRMRDQLTEVIFHVTTLMPTLEGNVVLAKKRLVGNDNVVIVWDESGEFSPMSISGEFNLVSLLITPILGGEYARLSVFRKREEVGHLLPMSLNQVVRMDVLGIVATQTALDADREAQLIMMGKGGQLPAHPGQGVCLRLQQIRKIRNLAMQASGKSPENASD